MVIGGGVGSCFEAVWLAIPLRVAFALFALRQLWLLVRWRRAQLRKALKEPRWGGGRGVAAQRMRGARSPSGLFGTRLHGTPGTPGAAGELSNWNNSAAT